MRPSLAVLLLTCLAFISAHPPNASHPAVNISFVKEVTVSIGPEDSYLTPLQEEDVSSLLDSGLRLFEPIMRFFDSLAASWNPPQDQAHGLKA